MNHIATAKQSHIFSTCFAFLLILLSVEAQLFNITAEEEELGADLNLTRAKRQLGGGNINPYELAWGFTIRRSCYVCAGCTDKGKPTECPPGMGRYCVETRYAPPIGQWKWDRYCYLVCPADVGANVEPYMISKCCQSDLCNAVSKIGANNMFGIITSMVLNFALVFFKQL